MSLLEDLFRHGTLRPLDHALAHSLRRLDAGAGDATPDAVLAGAALASLAVAQGHAAFDPLRAQALVDAPLAWPEAGAWQAALAASRWVAVPEAADAPAAAAPMVLEHGLLYLRRYREYERRLAAGLRRLAAHVPPAFDAAALAPLFATLFPQARDGDRQARAAALALARSLLLITGGPGTGKTTTVARLLVLLAARARAAGTDAPRIALAAPTGRAAERMAASLRAAVAALHATPGIDPQLCDALPQGASTLHRLLGTLPDRPRFRHDARNPLPVDVLVVDEASMVDLPLMCKLVEAVPDGARLVLLGDRDQLPSVEAGDVLAAMGDAAGSGETLPADVATLLAPLLGADATAGDAMQGGALDGHRVQLHRGYRQAETLDLAPLAAATRDGDAEAALALLQAGASAGVRYHEGLADPLARATREALLAPWRALQAIDDPTAALAHAGRQRVLTAVREGPQGARLLNARIEEALAGAHRHAYFHGRLLLVTENSYRHGLFNGDIGVCLRGTDGATTAWFPGEHGPRPFHPAALPAHSGAFAMTVHKAQGSEFDDVWLVLPRQDSRALSRELVYTAMTRARRALHVAAEPAVLCLALSRRTTRVSGLARRLATG